MEALRKNLATMAANPGVQLAINPDGFAVVLREEPSSAQ
jgi:hypothetical protein